MKPESEVQQEIKMDAPFRSSILMRNNRGAFTDITGRHVRFGLMNDSKKQDKEIKSSDLIGITSIVVTPEMVGQVLGVFTAIEVKEEGWTFNRNDEREQAQSKFIQWIRNLGGYAGFASSVEDFRQIIGK